jgi:hypothetical protein
VIRQSALSIVLGAALTAFAAGGGGAILAQSDDEPPVEEGTVEEEVTAEEAAPVIETTGAAEALELGGTYSAAPWDLKVQAVFDAESPTRAGWTEIRIAVSLRNNLAERIPYGDNVFFSDPLYPRLAIIDAGGTVRPLRLVRLENDAVGGSAIQHIGPQMAGRWTIGFEVPTIWADELSVAATDASGVALATWDLRSAANDTPWAAPSGLETVALGDTIDWLTAGPGSIQAVAVDFGSLVCGNPDFEHVTQVFALQIDVANPQGSDDIRWPGVTFPTSAATVMWGDGTTADVTGQTFAGERELLQAVSNDVFIVPPDENGFGRALLFGPTRDGRLGSVDDDPLGVLLSRPDAAPLWLDLSAASGSLELSPALCDDGRFGTRIPYAFAPSHRFAVSTVPLPPDPDVQDREARELLTRAAISANRFFIEEGDFENVSSTDLEDVATGVDFTNTTDNLAAGVVAWDSATPETLSLITLSGSGEYYCVGIEDGIAQVFANGPTLEDAATCESVGVTAEPADGDAGAEGTDEEAAPAEDGAGDGTSDGEGTDEGS